MYNVSVSLVKPQCSLVVVSGTARIDSDNEAYDSIGNDGVKLWNTKSLKALVVPEQNCAERGPVTALLWITRHQDNAEVLCFGTACGYLVIWIQRPVSITG